MTISATLVKSTPHVLLYLLEQDGQNGDVTLFLDNATMVADLSAGPLREMEALGMDIAGPSSQAACRKFMLGDGATVNTNHAHCSTQPQIAPLESTWAVDAEVDDVNPQRAKLHIVSQLVAGTAYLRIEFEHSLTR